MRPRTKQPHRTAASRRHRRRADPDEIAALFSVDVQFEIAGDVGALPWVGRRTGRSAAFDFIRAVRRLIEQLRFDVQDILASDDRAVIVGELDTGSPSYKSEIEWKVRGQVRN